MNAMSTSEERDIQHAKDIAVLQHQIVTLQKGMEDLSKKMDEILDLRAKGQGAFWVGAGLFGIGLTTLIGPIIEWFRGY
jgi:hypothetical protein